MRNAARMMLLLLVAGLYACASTPPPARQPVEVPPPKLQPPPANVMVKREANFRQRLLQIFSPSPTTPTTSPDSSGIARP